MHVLYFYLAYSSVAESTVVQSCWISKKKPDVYVFQQEEEGSLMNILKENVDKMQLTRRILDLKPV